MDSMTTVTSARAANTASTAQQCLQWRIFVSLDSLIQEDDDFERRKQYVQRLISQTKIGYSMSAITGGYRYHEGLFKHEASMAFLFIGARREDVEFVAEMLRKNLDQESVLITAEPIEYYYLFNQDASERAGAFAAFGATISAPEGAPLALPVSELAAKSFDGLENAYDQFDVALKIINATIVSERRNENDGEAENDGETETETESKLDSIGVRMTSENIGSTLQYEPVDCFTIYIGLEQRRTISDEEAKKQAARTIVNILRQRAIAYSLNVVYGGYEFEDGFFEQESLQITLIGASEDDVCTIASELCKNTNQDVALVTRGGLQSTYLTVN